jgi:hypothetical protein
MDGYLFQRDFRRIGLSEFLLEYTVQLGWGSVERKHDILTCTQLEDINNMPYSPFNNVNNARNMVSSIYARNPTPTQPFSMRYQRKRETINHYDPYSFANLFNI